MNTGCCGFLRRQELRELRLLQKEEQRAQQQLSNKLQQQKEQIYRRFEQETTVSHLAFCFRGLFFPPSSSFPHIRNGVVLKSVKFCRLKTG